LTGNHIEHKNLTGKSKGLQLWKGKGADMIVEVPDKLETALKAQANARGVSAAGYVIEILERNLAPSLEAQPSIAPFKTGRGLLAQYGQAPSAEEIDSNRAEMFRNFGEDF
jgi:hypothetical protein